jgi:hypothetical protein
MAYDGVILSFPASPRRIHQPIHALDRKSPTRFDDYGLRYVQCFLDFCVLPALRRQQHDPRSQHIPLRGSRRTHDGLQGHAFLGSKLNTRCSTCHDLAL